jgi:rod shape-determining protein MreD
MFDQTQKIDHFARMLLPAICTLLLLLISLLRVGLAGLAQFPVDVCLISIYYWAIFRPNALPFWFVFALGVVRDALMGTPLGISSLVFILFRLLVLTQQRFLAKESFIAMWLGFGLVLVPILTFHWLLASAYARALLPLGPLAMQWVFTFGFYPLLHILFNSLYAFLPGKPRSKSNPLL